VHGDLRGARFDAIIAGDRYDRNRGTIMPEGAHHGRSASAPTIMILLAALLGSASALGDDAGLARCRAIADPAARLACYDALPPAAEATPAPPASSPTQPVAAPQPQPPALQFGLEERIPPKDLVDQIDSSIPGKFEGWWPDATFHLANGQVWQVDDGSSRFYDLDSPKVTIWRGVLGAFYLNLEGDNHTVRVRRLQ
jgi:hypothetical protein